MTEFTDTDFLELFFDTGQVEYDFCDEERTDTGFRFSVCKLDLAPAATERFYALDRFESIKAAALPWSSSIADYLLRLVWIREVVLEMNPPTKAELFAMAMRVFALGNFGQTYLEEMEQGLDVLLQEEYLYEKSEHIPGNEKFENSWKKLYILEAKGRICAEKMVETKREVFARVKSPPIAPEPNNAISDSPPVIVVPSAEDIEQAFYSATMRASINMRHIDDQSRHWAMSKAGWGHMKIAKYENQKLAMAAEGNPEAKETKEAKKALAKKADKIRMQVKRMDETISGKKTSEKKQKNDETSDQ